MDALFAEGRRGGQIARSWRPSKQKKKKKERQKKNRWKIETTIVDSY